MSRLLLTFLSSLLFALCSFSQEKHQKQHGEYPDFIRPDAKIHFIYNNLWDSIHRIPPGTNEKYYSRIYSRFFDGNVIATHQINALALEKLDVDSYDYVVVMITDWKNPQEKRDGQALLGTPFRFTFYDQVTGKEWSQTLHSNNALGAQNKYFKKLKKIKKSVRSEPEVRTGEPFHNGLIQRLLEEKELAEKKVTVYYTKEDFLNKNGDNVGTFYGYSSKYIYYKNRFGEELKLNNEEFFRVKVDEYDLIPVAKYGLFVTPIGYREKYFYYNAATILQILVRSEESHTLGSTNPEMVHFVSDQELSEIYPLKDLKKDRESGFSVIFDCHEDENQKKITYMNSATKKSNDQTTVITDPSVLVPSEQYCVQKFLSGEL